MTMESQPTGDQPSSSELVRSMALSSAELWHELLERLTEVQQSQAALARAIEELGTIVRGALSSVGVPAGPAVEPGSVAPLAPAPTTGSLGSLPPPPAAQTPSSPDVVDALLGAAPPPPTAPAPETPTAAPSAPPAVPEPLFYVPPLMETKAAEDQALAPTAGAARPDAPDLTEPFQTPPPPPRSETPPLTVLPPVTANLTPDAVDALLAGEFGPGAIPSNPLGAFSVSGAPTSPEAPAPPVHADQSSQGSPPVASSQPDLLDSLLGSEFVSASSLPPQAAPAPQSPAGSFPATGQWAPHPGPPPPPPGFAVTPEAILGIPGQAAQPGMGQAPPPPGPPPPPDGPPGGAGQWQPPDAGGGPSDAMSLATEILGAAPAPPTPEDEAAAELPFAEDVIVRGRRRARFSLRR